MLHRFFLLLISVLLLAACSPKNNTASSRRWQAFVTRYNVFYNASQAYKTGVEAQESGLKDDYTQRLPLFSVGYEKQRSLGRNNFSTAITKCEKAIQLHSIRRRPVSNSTQRKTAQQKAYLSRKEFNPFLKNAWLLMGRAQFQQGDFVAAASTFAYITRFYAPEPMVANEARVWLARCYAELGWFYDAEDALNRLSRDSISPRVARERDVTMADFLIRQERLAEAVPYLERAAKQSDSRLQEARIYYILGQVQQELGAHADAYRAFGKARAKSPNYDLALHAQIRQSESIGASKSAASTIAKLRSMAREEKNKNHQELLFYAIGNLELARRDTAAAIRAYETGRSRATQASVDKGVMLVRLAQLYWLKRRFDKAQPCYTEAIGLLDKNRKDYPELIERSAVLDALVPHSTIVFEQDSMLALAAAPEATQWAVIDKAIAEYKKRKDNERKQRADSLNQTRNQGGGESENSTNVVPKTATAIQRNNAEWYFYNSQLVAQGKQSFAKTWGNRKNEDDWRRSNRSMVAMATDEAFDYAADDSLNALLNARRDSLANTGMSESEIRRHLSEYAERLEKKSSETERFSERTDDALSPNNDPTRREYYLQQLPLSPAAQEKAHERLQEAIYESGLIFKDRLGDYDLAHEAFSRIERDYPHHAKMNDVLYQQFLIARKMGDAARMEEYRRRMQQDFPQDVNTRLLSDPDFERNAQWARELEDSLYAATYAAYLEGRTVQVQRNYLRSQERYPNGANRPKFMLIHALAQLTSAPRDSVANMLSALIEAYPKHEVSEMSSMILRGLKEGRAIRSSAQAISSIWTRRSEDNKTETATGDGSRELKAEKDVPFQMLLVYERGKISDDRLLYELARFNFSHFAARGFDIAKEQGVGETRFVLSGFYSYADVHSYAQHLYRDSTLVKLLVPARAILISERNMRLLGTIYSYDDYRNFFDKHFSPFKIKKDLPIDFMPEDKAQPKQIYEDELPSKAPEIAPSPDDDGSPDEGEYYEDSGEYYDE